MPEVAVRRGALEDVLSSACRTVFEYWSGLLEGGFAPAWPAVNLIDLPSYVVQFVRVADVIDDGMDFKYRFWGTGMVDVIGEELTGRRVSSLDRGRAPMLTSDYQRVVADKAPVGAVYEADVVSAGLAGGPLRAFAIRLPLSSDGEAVNMVLSYTDYLSERDRWRDFYRAR